MQEIAEFGEILGAGGRLLHVEREVFVGQLDPSALTLFVDGGVTRDLEHPGTEVLGFAERVEAFERPGEGFLHEVGDGLRIANVIAHCERDRGGVGTVEISEREHVAVTDQCDEARIVLTVGRHERIVSVTCRSCVRSG